MTRYPNRKIGINGSLLPHDKGESMVRNRGERLLRNDGVTFIRYVHRNINLDHYQILRLYMVMGGVPAYLKAVQRGLSAEQNIEKCCFSKDGILTNEFNNLYVALFNNPDNHIEVIRALSRKNKGLTRSEILKVGKLLTGGTITKVLTELEESGFIQKTYPFGKQEKDSLFRLFDEYSLFYLKFMEKDGRQRDWSDIQKT